MARTVNVEARAVRREAFVDAAQRLMQLKGFDATSIQDVLDETGASRGAFYHYFDSKNALLDAVVDRMVEESLATIEPVIGDPALAAPDKLRAFFADIARYKTERRELVLALLDTWFSDENAVVREKFRRGLVRRVEPLLDRVVRQGQAEGTFGAEANGLARVLVSLIQGMNDVAVELFSERRAEAITAAEVQARIEAYNRAFERVLSVPAGSLPLGDPDVIHEWFD